MKEKLLSIENLNVGYDSNVIVENINFTVEEGEYISIVGENGAGKSTLMRTILGLQPALSGSVVRHKSLKKNDIGYLPQQTVVQKDFPASVWEIVLSGCQGRKGLMPFYTLADKKLAHDNMKKMEICNLKNRCYRELSGGQQQRVLLARALCATNKILLLDEPVSGLDSRVTEEMYELINNLSKEGITIIMITHDIAAALKYSDKIVNIGENIIYDGDDKEYVIKSYKEGGGVDVR